MSEPIIKGKHYIRLLNEISDAPYRERQIMLQSVKDGYIKGQQDMLDAGYKEMSHYQRRSTDEMPEEDAKIIVMHLSCGVDAIECCNVSSVGGQYGWYADSCDCQIGLINSSMIIWWSYLYIPEKEEK